MRLEIHLAVMGEGSNSHGRTLSVDAAEDGQLRISDDIAISLCQNGFQQPPWIDRQELVSALTKLEHQVTPRVENLIPVAECGQRHIKLSICSVDPVAA